jgi:antitoxin ParD1/3/4
MSVTLNISLNDTLRPLIDWRVAERGYNSSSEYMRDLVRRDLEQAQQDRFVALIDAGLQSELLPADFDLATHMEQHLKARRKVAKNNKA